MAPGQPQLAMRPGAFRERRSEAWIGVVVDQHEAVPRVVFAAVLAPEIVVAARSHDVVVRAQSPRSTMIAFTDP